MKPKAPEDRLGFLGCPASEVRRQPVTIPLLREIPHPLEAEGLAAGYAAARAPTVDRLFRPEEQDVGSGKDEVFVPATERQGEVNEASVAPQPACLYRETRRRPILGVERFYMRVGV